MDTTLPTSSGGLDPLGADALELAEDPDLTRADPLFIALLKDIQRGWKAKQDVRHPQTYIEMVEAIHAAHDGKFEPNHYINNAHRNGGSRWLKVFIGGEFRKRSIDLELLTQDVAEFLEYHARNQDALKRYLKLQRDGASQQSEPFVGSNSGVSPANARSDHAQPTPRVDHNDVKRGFGSGNIFYGRVRDIVINNGHQYQRDDPQ